MFLFVDYDPGLGGEYFCANLSRSPQCNTLKSHTYANSRTKIKDVFDQEFLKITPNPNFAESTGDHYDIVPVHRHMNFIQKHISAFRSIRLAYPSDYTQRKFVFQQRLHKVLLSPEPTGEYFLGLVKILSEKSSDLSWVKKVKPSMDTLTIHMLSKGFELTEENRQFFINKFLEIADSEIEPDFPYDVIVEFSDLLFDHKKIQDQLLNTLGIHIEPTWLTQYLRDYDAFLAQS
jgi:hypothetical protein